MRIKPSFGDFKIFSLSGSGIVIADHLVNTLFDLRSAEVISREPDTCKMLGGIFPIDLLNGKGIDVGGGSDTEAGIFGILTGNRLRCGRILGIEAGTPVVS